MEQENEKKVETGESGESDGVATDRVVEMEALLATRDGELAGANVRLAEMEQALAVSEGKLSAITDGLKKAVSSYRSLAVQSNRDVPDDLIKGDSVEAIDLALKSARELIGRVKTNLEAEKSSTRVPAGAPPRSSVTASGLSSREKIREGMEKVKS